MAITSDSPEMQVKLSPSAAARWIACPGSEYIVRRLPRLPSSDAAQEGTLAHEFAARAVWGVLRETTSPRCCACAEPPEPEAALATADMLEGAQTYADAVCAQCGSAFGGREFFWTVEDRVQMDDREGCRISGRLDFAAWTRDPDGEQVLLVADYKFGGEFVASSDNPQLLCYALCKADFLTHARGSHPSRIVVGIIQPRTEIADFSYGATWAAYDWAEFFERTEKIRLAAHNATAADDRTLRKTGPHCRWCAARSVCRAAIGERLLLAAIAAGEAEMQDDATDEQIGAWLDALRGMDTVRDDLTRIAKARIASGATIPGWRTQARKGKQWAAEIRDAGTPRAQAEALAAAIGGEAQDYIAESLKSPVAVAKTVPKDALAPVVEDTVTTALVGVAKK